MVGSRDTGADGAGPLCARFLCLVHLMSITSAIFFAVACVARSMMLSYVGVVALGAVFLLTGLAGSQPSIAIPSRCLSPLVWGFSDVTDIGVRTKATIS